MSLNHILLQLVGFIYKVKNYCLLFLIHAYCYKMYVHAKGQIFEVKITIPEQRTHQHMV